MNTKGIHNKTFPTEKSVSQNVDKFLDLKETKLCTPDNKNRNSCKTTEIKTINAPKHLIPKKRIIQINFRPDLCSQKILILEM